MENNIIKLFIKAIGFTILAVIISYAVIGKLLVYVFGNSAAKASYHIVAYALLIGLLFTIIFCTILILDRLKNK